MQFVVRDRGGTASFRDEAVQRTPAADMATRRAIRSGELLEVEL